MTGSPSDPLWTGYRTVSVLQGLLIYGIGDGIASLLLGTWSWHRMLGIMAIGGGWYSLEIPTWFRWIDRVSASRPLRRAVWLRMLLAAAWFNPLWIARHLLFLNLVSCEFDAIGLGLLGVGLRSFLINLPFSLLANYLIQNVLPSRHRFLASSSYSALTAIWYAVSARWVG